MGLREVGAGLVGPGGRGGNLVLGKWKRMELGRQSSWKRFSLYPFVECFVAPEGGWGGWVSSSEHTVWGFFRGIARVLIANIMVGTWKKMTVPVLGFRSCVFHYECRLPR